jgi:lycopene cyclase CruA
MAATARSKTQTAVPDLSDFRKRYPLTVSSLGVMADREAWLRRIWELDARWEQTIARAGDSESQEEVIVHGAPPSALSVEAEYDIIYAGGVLGLLHAAVMSCRYERRVMVFDSHTVGRSHRVWNI